MFKYPYMMVRIKSVVQWHNTTNLIFKYTVELKVFFKKLES